MDAWRFILASLRHYRRIHLAVALGVAVATAVLTGALLVGDSVRGSLRDLTLQRLGRIDSAIVVAAYVSGGIGPRRSERCRTLRNLLRQRPQPAILLSGTLQAGVERMRDGRLRFR